ncbi:MAG: metal ABC transporter substrate-binding protein, partial [Butyrivibrio sp.]
METHIKKIAASWILIMFFISACLTGCSYSGKRDNESLKVVSTIFASYDFARQISGECAEVTMLLKPGTESHSYEPTPMDIITLQECDIFIYVGGENDAWVDNILDSMDTSHMNVIKMMDLVDKYEEEHTEGMEGHKHTDDCDHGEHEEEHEEWDEHVWTSPVNAITICEAITEALVNADKDNADVYRSNSEKYIKEI